MLFAKSTPEQEGISSSDISALLKTLSDRALYMHSFLIIRNGKLITEAYYAPFNRDSFHRLYSSSKTFVSVAIGLLCDEGKLSLTDKVHTFFPEYPAESLHPYIRETTVRNLLMMSSPNVTTYSLPPATGRFATEWIESFFRTPPIKPAGTVFRYDTSATYILNVIVERLTGKPFLEYLKDKMLRELGFSEAARCVKSPEGYSWGGSGVLCTSLDFATLAFVLLRGGKVNGKQYISESYVKEATARQIEAEMSGIDDMFRATGYGYQIWRIFDNAFILRGMGSQLALCDPDKDLLIVCTGDTQGNPSGDENIMQPVYDYILKKASDKPLPENEEAYDTLCETLSSLSLYKPKGKAHSDMEGKINNVTYLLDENPLGFKSVRFTFKDNEGTLFYENERGKKEIRFGLEDYIEGQFPETHYCTDIIGTPKGSGYCHLAFATWQNDWQLLLRVNIVDVCFGSWTVSFAFNEDKIGLSATKVCEGGLYDYSGCAGGQAIKEA
ncbi:MAG: serine hydrolase [Ruminococcaceae bacterium]|nr:serine hydrolase [Oscillospiraceae bacterium]